MTKIQLVVMFWLVGLWLTSTMSIDALVMLLMFSGVVLCIWLIILQNRG